MRWASSLRAATRPPLLQLVKAMVATVGAWLAGAALLPGQLPIYGAVAALLVVQPSLNQSVGKAIERSVGVIAGVLIAYGIGVLFGSNSWIVLLTIVIAILAAWALKLPPGTSTQVPISAMLVLSIGATNPHYATDRVVETIVGAAIAIAVNLAIAPPVLLAPAHDAVVALLEETAATMARLADNLAGRFDQHSLAELLITARLLRPMQDSARKALAAADDSLFFNPRGASKRPHLQREADLFALATPLVTQVIGMARALHDHDDPTLRKDPVVAQIVRELRRAAHDLRVTTRRHTGEHIVLDVLTLDAPLEPAQPDASHWVLLGSMVEDLRRIHETIAGAANEVL